MAWFFSHQLDNWTECCIDSAERSDISITANGVLQRPFHQQECLQWRLAAGQLAEVVPSTTLQRAVGGKGDYLRLPCKGLRK